MDSNSGKFKVEDEFDYLNFNGGESGNNFNFHSNTNTNSNSNTQQAQQQQAGLVDTPGSNSNVFTENFDNFGLTPDINIGIDDDHIKLENDSSSVTPFNDPSTFIDLNDSLSPNALAQAQAQQQLSGSSNNNAPIIQANHRTSQGGQHTDLPPNSFQSQHTDSIYATSYNNLNFNDNNNINTGNSLNTLISPNDFSDFAGSPYGSSFAGDSSLMSPPTMNSPTFSPSSLSSSIKNLSKEEKLRRRREFHNAVERRRRDLIKDRIKELGQLIPPSLLFDIQFNKDGKEVTKESRANKSIILNKTVEYIIALQSILASQDERLELLKQKIDERS